MSTRKYEMKIDIFSGTGPQLRATLAATLVVLSDGMNYGWTAPVLPVLFGENTPLKITEMQGEWLENVLFMGAFCGIVPTIYAVSILGRKNAIILSAVVALCCWVILGIIPSIELVYVARVFTGAAGNMANVATPMYIAEIADQYVRGFLSSLIYIMMLLGILLLYSIVPYTPYYIHCVIGAGLALTGILIFPFMPDSPYYLITKNKHDKAKRALERLRTEGSDIETEMKQIIEDVERQTTEKGGLLEVIRVPSNRRALLIMLVLNCSQHFSSISVMLMNVHIILDAAGSIYLSRSIAGILFACAMVLAAIIGSCLMDIYGRKVLLVFSGILTGTALLILALFFNFKQQGYYVNNVSWIPILSVIMYAFFFKMGLGLVPIVLTSELFPTKVKAISVTLCDTFYVVSSLLSLQIYHSLKRYGWEYPFYFFSASCFVAVIFTYFYVPETKGKSLEEIQWILKKENKQ